MRLRQPQDACSTLERLGLSGQGWLGHVANSLAKPSLDAGGRRAGLCRWVKPDGVCVAAHACSCARPSCASRGRRRRFRSCCACLTRPTRWCERTLPCGTSFAWHPETQADSACEQPSRRQPTCIETSRETWACKGMRAATSGAAANVDDQPIALRFHEMVGVSKERR